MEVSWGWALMPLTILATTVWCSIWANRGHRRRMEDIDEQHIRRMAEIKDTFDAMTAESKRIWTPLRKLGANDEQGPENE